ncbi:MAG: HEAT repeat domain-containing protein [Nitrospinae bacterium]|nr:HEAT repeat domain-containing protein [Nitrospinota bacterium]
MDEVDIYIEQLKSNDFSQKRIALEVLGQMDDVRAILPIIETFDDEEWQIRNSAIDALVFLNKEESIPPLIKLLKSENASIRNSAICALERMGGGVVEYLKNGLNDSDIDVVIFTANTLGFIGSAYAVDCLIDALESGSKDENVVFAIIEALGRIKSPRATEVIVKGLKKADVWDKFNYLTALGNIGDERATQAVLECYDDEETLEVALVVAGEIGDELALEKTIKQLCNADSDIQKAAINTLCKIKTKLLARYRLTTLTPVWLDSSEKLKQIDFNKISSLIEEIFEGNDIELQEATLKLLKFSDYQISGKYIFNLLEQELLLNELVELYQVHPYLEVEALFQQVNKRDEAFLVNVINFANSCMIELPEKFIIAAIKHPYEEIKINIAVYTGLQNAFTDEIINLFIEYLRHKNKKLRDSINGALLMIVPNENFNKRVQGFLNSPYEDLMNFALRYIAINDSGLTVDVVTPFFNSHFAEIRTSAVIAAKKFLGNIDKNDNEKLILKLQLLLNDESPQVQVGVIHTLEDVLNSEIVEMIKRTIVFSDNSVKIQGIKTVASWVSEETDDYLIDCLDDSSQEIKLIAINAMEKCKSPDKIIKILSERMENFSSDLIAESIEVIGEIGSEKDSEKIKKFLTSDDWFIKVSTITSLGKLKNPADSPLLIKELEKTWNVESQIIIVEAIISALLLLKPVEAVVPLSRCLTVNGLQRKVYRVLNVIAKENQAPCIDLLKSDNAIVRMVAISILGQNDYKEIAVIKDLVENDPYPSVKRVAAEVLHYINCIEHFELDSIQTGDEIVQNVVHLIKQ